MKDFVVNKEEMLTTVRFILAYVIGMAAGIIGGLVVFG